MGATGLLVFCLTVAAHGSVLASPGAPPKLIPAPAGKDFGSVLWSAALRRLIVTADPVSGPLGSRIATVALDGKGFQELPFVPDSECSRESLGGPRQLPDGRLAYSHTCIKPPNHPCLEERGGCVPMSLKVYDPKTQMHASLRPYRVLGGCMSFSPKTGQGLYAQSDGLTGALYSLGANRLVPIKLPVSNVGCAEWSPDEKYIVVDGIPTSAGPNSPTRLDIPWALYLLDSKGRLLRKLPPKINDNAVPAWSPDGRWLAYRTTAKFPLMRVWLLDMRRREARPRMLLQYPALGDIAWLPDSRRLVLTSGGSAYAGLGHPVPSGFLVIPIR